MPSFSRGLCAQVLSFSNMPLSHTLAKPLPARIIYHGHVPIPRHLFSTISRLQAQAKTKPASPKPTPATPAAAKPIAAKPPTRQPTTPSRQKPSQKPTTTPYINPPSPAYAAQLAAKSSPTLLYEAPNHFWFTFSAFNAGAFCMAYTAVQYYSVYLHPPPDLAWWVPHAYGLICVTMGAFGTYWLRWPSRIIRSITALPASDFRHLKLEITTRRLLPFLPWKKTVVAPYEVSVPAKVVDLIAAATKRPGMERLTEKEKLMLKAWEEEKKQKERQYELDHIMTAPFRHAGRGMKTAIQGITRALTRDGFANITVGKGKYKIDAKSGWFLDEGRGLDRLLHAKEEQATFLEKVLRG